MNILRSDLVMALDGTQQACAKASQVHRALADAIEDGALSQELARLAQARDDAAAWLAEELRARDDAPHPPPGELGILKKAEVWAESLVGQDRATVLQHGIDAEQAVVEAAAEAATHAKDADTAGRLGDLHDDARRQVAALRGRVAAD